MNTPLPHLDPELLSAYLDDEVGQAERAQVAAHLAGCAQCRAELDSLRVTAALLAQLPPVPLPRTFYVTEAMVAPPQRQGWLARWRPLLGTVAAVAALLLVMVVVRLPNEGQPETTAARSAETAAAPEIAVGVAATEPAMDEAETMQADEAPPASDEVGVAADTGIAEDAAESAPATPEVSIMAGESFSEGMTLMAPDGTATVALAEAPATVVVEAEADVAQVATPEPTPVAAAPVTQGRWAGPLLALALLGAAGIGLWAWRRGRA